MHSIVCVSNLTVGAHCDGCVWVGGRGEEAVIPIIIALSRATRDRRIAVALKTREPRRALPVAVALADAGLQVRSGPVVAPLQLDVSLSKEEEQKEGEDEREEGEAGCHDRVGAERGGGEGGTDGGVGVRGRDGALTVTLQRRSSTSMVSLSGDGRRRAKMLVSESSG